MARGLTSTMQTEIAKQEVRLVHLVEFGFDGGTIRVTDAYADITYGGNIYSSTGGLLNITALPEALDLRVGSFTVTLSGVSQSNLAQALTENFVGRSVIVYRGLINTSWAVIADPLSYKGFIDRFAIVDDNRESSTIAWQCASHLADFERTAGRRTNDSDQQLFFPWDKGLEFAPLIIKDLQWGKS